MTSGEKGSIDSRALDNHPGATHPGTTRGARLNCSSRPIVRVRTRRTPLAFSGRPKNRAASCRGRSMPSSSVREFPKAVGGVGQTRSPSQ